MKARRVLVYGVTGSGKTTFAKKLAERTGIPFHEVDALTWEPGWVEVPVERQIARIREICSRDQWILDSAYTKWLDIPLQQADLIIALDYSRAISFTRLLKRTAGRILDQKPICNGNRESWRLALSRDSILLWHFRTFARKRRRINGWIGEGRNIIRLTSPKDADTFLQSCHR